MRATRTALRICLPALLVAGTFAWAPPAHAASITVDTTAAYPGAAGDCTLGEAIESANTDAAVDACPAGSGADTVVLPSGTYSFAFAGNSTGSDGPVALPPITSSITIDGANPTTTVIERSFGTGDDFGLMHMHATEASPCWPDCTFTLKDTTVQNATGYGGGILNRGGHVSVQNSVFAANDSGPVIVSTGSELSVANSFFTNNVSSSNGGVIYTENDTTISSSTFSTNSAARGGAVSYGGSTPPTVSVTGSTFSSNTADGGGAIDGNGTLEIMTSTFEENAAVGGLGGGAISASGSATVTRSVFDENFAGADGSGGAIDAWANLTVVESTFSANSARGSGGAIATHASTTTIKNSTVSGNGALVQGGGIHLDAGAATIANVTMTGNSGSSGGGGLAWQLGTGTLALRNSIIAGNTGAPSPNCGGDATVTSQGHNLIGDKSSCPLTTGTGDQSGTSSSPIDPLLGALDTNGGSTPTHALQSGSPAIDAGNTGSPGSGGVACESTDQRGQLRPRDGDGNGTLRCDIGAFEAGGSLPTLAVNSTGTGTGIVASQPAGIDCGADCAEAFAVGTSVTLSATPAPESTFVSWTGCDSTAGDSCTVSMSSDRTVTVNFRSSYSMLNVERNGAGSGTVTSNPAGINCGSDCSESYFDGTSVVLTAAPGSNSNFGSWAGCDSTSGATCTVTMSDARSVTATFNAVQRTLTVTKNGAGGGTVSSNPAGVDCGSDCSHSYSHGTIVTLTASPDGSSVLTSWTGCGSTATNTCTVTMSAARSVTATFGLAQRALTVSKNGTGSGTVTSTPSGIDCGLDCTESYSHGTSVTLTPSLGQNSTFGGWSGCDSTAGSNCTVSMNGARSVTATFTLLKRTLTVAKSGAGTGTVSSEPAGVDCGLDCTDQYDHGTNVTLTAVPGANTVFSSWSGCTSSSGTSCTVAMSSAKTVTATFAMAPRALTVSKTGNGTGSVTSSPVGIDCGSDCVEDLPHGSAVTLTPVAGANSAFDSWTGCDSTVGTNCLVTMNGARAVTANFVLLKRTLTVSKAGAGLGTVSSEPAGIDCGLDCTDQYDHGTSVVLTPAAGANSVFSSWSGCSSTTGNTCTVSMTAAKTVTATFALAPRSLVVTKDGAGIGTVSSTPAGIDCGSDCAENYPHGTAVTLTPTAGANSVFAGWSGCDSVSGTACTVDMLGGRTPTATFNLVQRALSVSLAGTGSGAVASDLAGIDCGTDCFEAFDHGTVVVLTPTPGENSAFGGWSGCTSVAGTACTVSMTAVRNVTAGFVDLTLPTSSASAPAASSTTAVQVIYEASGGAGSTLSAVELWVNGPGAGGYVQVDVDNGTEETGSFDFTATEGDGQYSFYTRAQNTSNNLEEAPGSPDATTLVDTTAPTSSATSPTSKQIDFAISYTAADGGSGLDAVELWVDGPGAAGFASVATDDNPAASGSFPFKATEGPGEYRFYTRARDGLGNYEDAPGAGDSTTTLKLCTGFFSDPRPQIVGTDAAQTITGTAAAEIICGLGGNDTLKSLGGADLLLGGAGNDIFFGGAGADTFKGEAGLDTVSYSDMSSTKPVVVTVGLGANDGTTGEKDNVAAGTENVTGGAGKDTITGDKLANKLKGGGGKDLVKGAGGADGLYGDAGTDKLDGGGGKDLCKTGETYVSCEKR